MPPPGWSPASSIQRSSRQARQAVVAETISSTRRGSGARRAAPGAAARARRRAVPSAGGWRYDEQGPLEQDIPAQSSNAVDDLLGLERALGEVERLFVAGARPLGQLIHMSNRAKPDDQHEQQQTAEPEEQPGGESSSEAESRT